jgi:hypothetical protein
MFVRLRALKVARLSLPKWPLANLPSCINRHVIADRHRTKCGEVRLWTVRRPLALGTANLPRPQLQSVHAEPLERKICEGINPKLPSGGIVSLLQIEIPC